MAAPGFSFDPKPDRGASAYFRSKDLRPAFRWSEVWGQEHAYAFTVAKAVQLDVLAAIKDSLQKAIDEGVPFKAWSAGLKPELERMGWWGVKDMADPATGEIKPAQLGSPRRLATIYDANLRTARAAGQWERAQRTKAALPYFEYQLGPSIHHRPEHEAREGFIAPVDDPVWNAWYPPNGWGCKCWLQQITRTRAAAAGGPSDTGTGELATRTFGRRRDDGSVETVKVPKGIDPGWANNPGKARAATLMTALSDKLSGAGPQVARQAIADLWGSQTAQALASVPESFDAPAAIATPGLRKEVGSDAAVVQISAASLAGILGKSQGEISPSDVGRVQGMIDDGQLVRTDAGLVASDGAWRAMIGPAPDGGLFVTDLMKGAAEAP